MRLKLISCEIFYREICAVVAHSPNMVDVEFLPKGLHDIGSDKMLARLQAVLDAVDDAKYDAVVLGYGLCGMGLVGLTARNVPLVVPRAHDCITHFLGSKERYAEYFQNHPGVYFKTTGWIERGNDLGQLTQQTLRKSGLGYTYAELVEKYGEDNAKFLYEELCDTTRNYQQFTFIEMGVEPDARFERSTREEAAKRGWRFEKIRGDMSLLERLVDAEWDDRDFLVVPPGWRIVPRYDESVIGAEQADSA